MIISFTLVTLINVRFSGDIMKGYAQFVTWVDAYLNKNRYHLPKSTVEY